jgi:hypothetical protein
MFHGLLNNPVYIYIYILKEMECSPRGSNLFKYYLLILVVDSDVMLHITGHQAVNTLVTCALSYLLSETPLIICFITLFVLGTDDYLSANGIGRFSARNVKTLKLWSHSWESSRNSFHTLEPRSLLLSVLPSARLWRPDVCTSCFLVSGVKSNCHK